MLHRRSLAAVLAAAACFLAAGAVEAAPATPHELALRNLIEAAARGQVDDAALTPELAAAVAPQKAIAQSDLTTLGKLISVRLERTDPSGDEIYLTTFEHGALEWAFAMTPEGKIANAMYRKPKSAAP